MSHTDTTSAPIPGTADPDRHVVGWSLGGRFLEALVRRDLDASSLCLNDDARLRALIPPGPIEVHGGEAVADRLASWFGGNDTFEVLDATAGEAGSKLYLRWRVRLTPTNGEPARVVEQHAFVTASSDITDIDLLCSGFFAEPASPGVAHQPPQPGGPSCPST